ncbi:glycosyltransferase family 2 protein [Psychroflexus sp. CAK1W]|uniref:glycosyltransferase family 2 protein n=1 Tax=Psychroflexus curvus TaxID=2873595 RepID=UPI001CCA619C|nr:glycosyltransferase family 2 protein [Psychroflexus curvus]MBZ9628906.1 glycosyltransferase family 2 protein [Psychroflexus curvus]
MIAPKVTIIMATYNRAHLIEETLISIQNQTYPNWECLIIDDGGTDNTEEVIRSILAKDSRFTYYNRPDNYQKGLPGCRNYGLDLAKGDFIIFFDDDDIVHPQNLELSVRFLENNEIDFVHYSKKPFIKIEDISIENYSKTEISYKIDLNNLYDSILGNLGLASCTIMWKKYVFDEYKFDETLQYAEEWDLYNRLLISGYEGFKIDSTLYFNRKHHNSNTARYYRHNPIYLKSKIAACISIINSLDDNSLINKKYIKFFLGLRKKSESESIYNALRRAKSIGVREKLYVKFRYAFLPQLKYVYVLKNKI